MPLTIEALRRAQWADAQRRGINCWVKFKEFPAEVPFHAVPDDPEPHGREIFERLIAGEAGTISA